MEFPFSPIYVSKIIYQLLVSLFFFHSHCPCNLVSVSMTLFDLLLWKWSMSTPITKSCEIFLVLIFLFIISLWVFSSNSFHLLILVLCWCFYYFQDSLLYLWWLFLFQCTSIFSYLLSACSLSVMHSDFQYGIICWGPALCQPLDTMANRWPRPWQTHSLAGVTEK